MAAIITTLLSIFGPILGKFLKDWLDSLLNKASKKVTATGDDEQDTKALLTAGLKLVPKRQIFRRALLYRLIAIAPDAVVNGGLDAEHTAEIKNLVAGARLESDD